MNRHREGRLTFRVRFFRLANELVSLVLSHLATAHHVLHEVARTLDREAGKAGGRTDDILHRRRHLAPGFEADLLSLGRHFRDSIADVRSAMSGSAGWRRDRSDDGSGGWRLYFRGRNFIRHLVWLRTLERSGYRFRGNEPGELLVKQTLDRLERWRQVYDFSTATQGATTVFPAPRFVTEVLASRWTP